MSEKIYTRNPHKTIPFDVIVHRELMEMKFGG